MVGLQTQLAVPGHVRPRPTLDALDKIILAIFTLDIIVKIVAEGEHPLHYFSDNWNKFDFFIVFACYIFLLPFMPSVGSVLSMLRLLRLLRVLKLIRALPELRVIIEALISGFSSIAFVTLILFIFYYVFANIGMMIFQQVTPFSPSCIFVNIAPTACAPGLNTALICFRTIRGILGASTSLSCHFSVYRLWTIGQI